MAKINVVVKLVEVVELGGMVVDVAAMMMMMIWQNIRKAEVLIGEHYKATHSSRQSSMAHQGQYAQSLGICLHAGQPATMYWQSRICFLYLGKYKLSS